MAPTRGAGGGKRVLWRTYNQARAPNQFALRGLRALRTLLRAATAHAAPIQGDLATLRAAACKSLHG